MMATTWTVSLAPGTASLAPVMVRLVPPGTTSLSTGDSKSGTRGGVSGTRDRVRQAWHRGRYNPGTSEPEPGTCDQGAPGTADGAGPGTVCLLAMIWTMHEPGTGMTSMAPVTVLCSVRVHTRGYCPIIILGPAIMFSWIIHAWA